ncbi:MAG: hypothetical protein ACMUIU_08735 [bacterium]
MNREELKEIIAAVVKKMEASSPASACGLFWSDCRWFWRDEGVTTLYGIGEEEVTTKYGINEEDPITTLYGINEEG